MFSEDMMIYPKESALFGQIQQDGEILPMEETDTFYNIGLNEVAERGDIVTHEFEGPHLRFSMADIEEYVLPILLS